jgi:gamma-glutamyltranspeptidase/glutathione hydrolase
MVDSSLPRRQIAQTLSPGALIATSQPLAVQAGLEILREGGNAVDAAVATAAVLNVVEPMSTGVGGDLFALVYNAQGRQLRGLNASGRAPRRATLETYKKRGYRTMPQARILSVTVPGTVHGWVTLLDELGSLPLSRVLEPAIWYAEHGFPVSEVIAHGWGRAEEKLKQDENASQTYLINGKAPQAGEVFKNPRLAQTFRVLAKEGAEAFYRGELAREIVAESERHDGLFALDDLAQHRSTWVEPISTDYLGYRVYELPPNGQGLITLEALNLISAYAKRRRVIQETDDAEHLHVLIEALKLAFADARSYIADPDFAKIPLEELLSTDYAVERSRLIGERANSQVKPGSVASDTVYVTVVDEERNCVSLINSLYESFGSGVVVGDAGIVLQNRGALFSLDEKHANALAPGKRPYHTIIPAMVFRYDKPWMSLGVVGGFMQPQGQVQILSNLIDRGMGLQEAIDAPRFRWLEGADIVLEPSISAAVRAGLAERGHEVLDWTETMGGFGGAQAILIDQKTNMLYGASDPRKDGCAQGF